MAFIKDNGRYYATLAGPTGPQAAPEPVAALQIPPQKIGSHKGYDIYLQPLPPTALVTMVVRPHPLGTIIIRKDGQQVAQEPLTGQESPLAVGKRLISQLTAEEKTVTQPEPTAPKPETTPAGLNNGVKLAIGLGAAAAALALLK